MLGAAPAPAAAADRGRSSVDEDYGVEVTLRGEIPIRFGSGSSARPRSGPRPPPCSPIPKLDALTYVDVRVPERPDGGRGGLSRSPRASADSQPEVEALGAM